MPVQLTAKQWQQYGPIYLRGRCYQGEEPLPLATLAVRLEACTTPAQVAMCMQSVRGELSLVIAKPQLFCIAVSHTRLYPLFYRWHDGVFEVSDTPMQLLKKGDKINQSSYTQYIYTGAPFAGNTLNAAIKQCRPACVTSFLNKAVDEVSFSPFVVAAVDALPCANAQATFAEVLRRVFLRTVRSIGQRQVVVPLSGGYDSRLVVAMLHQMGVKNIVCYTVGENHPAEQDVARKVADALQLPIYHIDYRQVSYRMQQVNSPHFLQYVDHIGAMGNFMWLFEYNAILWLKQQGVLQDDAIFIPGHVGDFYAGSHLQKLGLKENDSMASIRRKLLLHAFEYQKPYWDATFKKELYQAITPLSAYQKPYRAALQFIAENRLAHQILNSARVYESLGYDVLLPLCDVDFVQFFDKIPYAQRSDVSFYQNYVVKQVFEPLGIAFKKQVNVNQLFKQRIKNVFKLFVPRMLYLQHKQRRDVTTEWYLLDELFAQLQQKGVCKSKHDFANGNELMLLWYLGRVEQQLSF